ncbi:glycosyltransferase family 10 [Helicobacter sp. faydin-H76]|uniref:Glycosyltransferase family 10 n=1 Tax=Helicobacter cappadocius TaxID=3063998 RepID=A0AA90TBY7_9HELI|nr:glycosyltransferase family 10 [Helicobacter sp. faydin-H76]MDP2539286.1 glycosyltransferase family 10 [Helicobacter sp. faydin-H76]
MKPTIKLKILDWWRGESFYDNYFVRILSKKYNVIEEENPDYVLYSVFGYEHRKYDCIRIFFTGENICPDFNICDYAIGFNDIVFEDRYIRYPLYLLNEKDMERAVKKHIITDDIMQNKTKFCNYIYSHSNSSKLREEFFDLLSNSYKKVDSAGIYRNNIGFSLPIINGDFSSSKYEFMKNYKFTIAFENSSTNGYTTEKIIQAFGARTIPIYWGNPKISDFSLRGGGGK